MSAARPDSAVRRLAGWFLRGLVLTAPAAVTLWITWAIIRWVDGLLGIDIPGIGLLLTLAVITGIGALASGYFASGALAWLERLLEKVPFVRLLYTSSKDLLNAFVGEKRRFTQAVRVALTEDGALGVIGFITVDDLAELGLPGHVAVYLPQSYNFAGNLITVPRSRVTPIAADSAEVMAFVVSGGVAGRGAKPPA